MKQVIMYLRCKVMRKNVPAEVCSNGKPPHTKSIKYVYFAKEKAYMTIRDVLFAKEQVKTTIGKVDMFVKDVAKYIKIRNSRGYKVLELCPKVDI